MMTPKISAILLAAGESRRMGQNKLLLPWHGKTVIESIVATLNTCALAEIVVVLGHQAELIQSQLQNQRVSFSINHDFRSGMLSSVQSGVRAASSDAAGYLLCLGDQPTLSAQIIQPLIDAFTQEQASIILPSYRGSRGHPLLIAQNYRDAIFKLDPDVGLRQLRLQHASEVLTIEVPNADVLQDLDYPEDYRRALKSEKKKG
jgi:molybdenum cofactor cytidylyltransferase